MNSLQDKLVELSEYAIGFNVYDGNFLVHITYHEGWAVIEPSDSSITFMRDKKDGNTYYYSAPLTTDMSKIFSAIEETISYNKELEEKVVLFKEKVEEMQELFSRKSISELRKMRFDIPSSQRTEKPKKKTAQKRKPKADAAAVNPTVSNEDGNVPEVQTTDEDIDSVIMNAIKEKEVSENASV